MTRVAIVRVAAAAAAEAERERKKQAALSRQAKVMAQFQAQQKSFLEKQGGDMLDWKTDDEDDDENDEEDEDEDGEAGDRMDVDAEPSEQPHHEQLHKKGKAKALLGQGKKKQSRKDKKDLWKYPSGTCILCQEATDDRRLYGTFSLFAESRILRQTDLQDRDYVAEAAQTPSSLDRAVNRDRPTGLAGQNWRLVPRVNARGETVLAEVQRVARGFPPGLCRAGTMSTSCGHMMHFSCFETYIEGTRRRHLHQIARHHPEDPRMLEFVCPLCKALGNAFLPVIWRPREEAYPGALRGSASTTTFGEFLDGQMKQQQTSAAHPPLPSLEYRPDEYDAFVLYTRAATIGTLAISAVTPAASLVRVVIPSPPAARSNLGPTGMTGAVAAAVAAAAALAPVPALVPPPAPAEPAAASGTSLTENHLQFVMLHRAYRRLKDMLRANRLAAEVMDPSKPVPAGGIGSAPDPDAATVSGSGGLGTRNAGANGISLIPTVSIASAGAGASTLRIYPIPHLSLSDGLVEAVGYTISAVEISQRGIDAPHGLTLVERIPEHTLAHLRILSETASSFLAFGGLQSQGSSPVAAEFRQASERQHCQLFIGQYLGTETEHARRPVDSYLPILTMDPFLFLVESLYGVGWDRSLDPIHMVRICYLAELVKLVFHMGRNIPFSTWAHCLCNRGGGGGGTAAADGDAGRDRSETGPDRDPVLVNFASFAWWITSRAMEISGNHSESLNEPGANQAFAEAFAMSSSATPTSSAASALAGYYSFVRRYALVFLRKCTILLHAKFAVRFSEHRSSRPHDDELDRLTEALQLPSFDEMCSALTEHGPTYGWPPSTRSLIRGWIEHQIMCPRSVSVPLTSAAPPTATGVGQKPMMAGLVRTSHPVQFLPNSAVVSHPAIFELVGLPKSFAALIEESSRRRCPTTGNELSEPLICLFCGAFVCCQSKCCTVEQQDTIHNEAIKTGGAQQHMKRCQKNIGIFINIRKCACLYLFRSGGSYSATPYLSKYGEVDYGFRHGRELFLLQKRYDSTLRNMVLGHGVPAFISRKLESEINNGGWETL